MVLEGYVVFLSRLKARAAGISHNFWKELGTRGQLV